MATVATEHTSRNLADGTWPCDCPANQGDPSDFCDACRADWERWLDELVEERRAEWLAGNGLDWCADCPKGGAAC